MTVQDLPPINAGLNGLSTLFIVIGLVSIKSDRKQGHIAAMTAALITSTLFLACYVTYHVGKGGIVTRFTHPGWPRTLYLFILVSHSILAAITPALTCTPVRPNVL